MPPTDLLSSDGDGRPDSSLSSHNPPSTQDRREPYYSNEEISIVYESVLRGQEILAADEKRTLTETAALFEGSEQIFPQHGISTDDPRLSRLLFKIGGKRGVGPGLLRKFRSVLESMDIEINLDGQPLQSTDAGEDGDRPALSSRSNSFAQLPIGATNSSISSSPRQRSRVGSQGDLPFGSHPNGHSRIHADNLAESVPNQWTAKTNNPARVRAVSFASSLEDSPARTLPPIAPQTLAAQGGLGLSVNNAPSGPSSQATSQNQTRPLLRPLPEAFGRVSLPPRPSVPPSVSSAAESPQRPPPPVRSLPAPQAQHDLPMLSRWLQSSIANPRSFRTTSRSVALDVPEINWAGSAHLHQIEVAESSLDADEIVYEDDDGNNGEAQLYNNNNNNNSNLAPDVASYHSYLPLRSKTAAETRVPETDMHDADVSGNEEADGSMELLSGYVDLLGPETSDAIGLVRHLSPSVTPKQYSGSYQEMRRQGQELGPDHKSGARHSETPLPPYGSPPIVGDNFAGPKWQQSISTPPASHPVSYVHVQQNNLEGESELRQPVLAEMARAHQSFNTRRVGRLLQSWRDQRSRVSSSHDYMESVACEMERRSLKKQVVNVWRLAAGMAKAQRAEAAETARQLVETARREERVMRRAERAYELSLLHKAFTHWWTAAQEEVERTEIARRHLLRKKVFDGWSQRVSADKFKAFNFAATGLLQAWRRATQNKKDEEQIALQTCSRGLLSITFTRLFRRHQECTADVFNSARLRQGAIVTWTAELQSATKLWGAAKADASHMHQSNAMVTWQARHSDISMFQSVASSLVLDHDAAGIIGFWRKQAKLERSYREFSNFQRENIKALTLTEWRQATVVSRMLAAKADTNLLKDFAQHWLRELLLGHFRRRRDQDLLYNQLYEWLMEERCALFYRYSEYNRTVAALSDLQAAHDSEKLRQRQLCVRAERFRRHALLDSFLGSMRFQGYHNEAANKKLACRIDLQRVVGSTKKAWIMATGELEDMAHDAQLGAYWTATTTCLEGWPSFAREVRRHRLATTYHAASRLRKKRMATDALASWQEALHDKLVVTWESEAALQDRQLHETIDLMNTWIGETNRMIFMGNIANEADVEVNVNVWRVIVRGLENQDKDAALYDIERLGGATLEVWELELVKLKGWIHTAAELADKNKKRLARQALGFWLSQTQPRQREADDNMSMGGKTPLRASLRRSYTATAPPNFGGSVLSRPGGRFGNADQDSWNITARSQQEQALAKRTEELSRPREQDNPRRPAPGSSPSQPMPSAWFTSRYGSSTSANAPHTPQPKAQYSEKPPVSQHSTRAHPGAGLQDSILPPISERSEASTRRFSRGSYPNTAPEISGDSMRGPSADRIRSFQEKLALASRFADSVQLGPMSEFDEDDNDDQQPYRQSAQFGTSMASSAFPNTPAAPRATGSTLPPAIVVNTPTRFQGTTRLPPVATTTPMAPLPSPIERQLRQEYAQPPNGLEQEPSTRPILARGARSFLGTGGSATRPGGSSRLARSWAATGQQPRVTFEAGLIGADEDKADNAERFTNF